MIIIWLWCANHTVHTFRSFALANYLKQSDINKQIDVICSGGQSGRSRLSEAEKMQKILLPTIKMLPHTQAHIEWLSRNTAENVVFSVIHILNNFSDFTNREIAIFTSNFHIHRTQRIVKYWIEKDFPEINSHWEYIPAEDFAPKYAKNYLSHSEYWNKIHEEFAEWEKRWAITPVEKLAQLREPRLIYIP